MPDYQPYSRGAPKATFRLRIDRDLMDALRVEARDRNKSIAFVMAEHLAAGVARRGKKARQQTP